MTSKIFLLTVTNPQRLICPICHWEVAVGSPLPFLTGAIHAMQIDKEEHADIKSYVEKDTAASAMERHLEEHSVTEWLETLKEISKCD